MGDRHLVGHIEAADGSDLAVINGEVEVGDLVCAVKAFRDADLRIADLSVLQSALLIEKEHVVESWCDD